jgi:hypothetical protein
MHTATRGIRAEALDPAFGGSSAPWESLGIKATASRPSGDGGCGSSKRHQQECGAAQGIQQQPPGAGMQRPPSQLAAPLLLRQEHHRSPRPQLQLQLKPTSSPAGQHRPQSPAKPSINQRDSCGGGAVQDSGLLETVDALLGSRRPGHLGPLAATACSGSYSQQGAAPSCTSGTWLGGRVLGAQVAIGGSSRQTIGDGCPPAPDRPRGGICKAEAGAGSAASARLVLEVRCGCVEPGSASGGAAACDPARCSIKWRKKQPARLPDAVPHAPDQSLADRSSVRLNACGPARLLQGLGLLGARADARTIGGAAGPRAGRLGGISENGSGSGSGGGGGGGGGGGSGGGLQVACVGRSTVAAGAARASLDLVAAYKRMLLECAHLEASVERRR